MLKRKMLRDFKLHSEQFIAIFLLSFIAICLYTGIASEVDSVVFARKVYQQETNLANGWIYGNNFNKNEIDEISSLNNVCDTQGRLYVKADGENDTCAFLYFQDENIVSKPMVLEGEEYNPEDPNGIWIFKRFAAEQNLSIGDDYSVKIDGEKYTFKIKGLIWSPEYEYYKNEIDLEPNYKDNNYGFASIYSLPKDKQVFNQIVFTSTLENVADLESDSGSILNNNYSVFLGRDGITSLTSIEDEISQHRMMSILFPAFFVVIAILTTVTTMRRIVDRQRTQIGTLKAIGMKKSKIYLHYLGYGFYPSLVGTILGTILGPQILSPMLFKMKFYLNTSDEYMLPQFDVKYSLSFWMLSLVIVALCTLSTWLSCRRILKINPATALRPAQPKSAKKTLFEKLPFWDNLSFSNRYNLRDISRNRMRTIFGLAGTISCMALLLCGFAAKDNFKNAVANLYADKLLNNSSMITINKEVTIDEAERLRDFVNGELIMSDTVEIKVAGSDDKSSYHMNVYEGDSIANVLDEDLNAIKIKDDDFTITQKTAEKLGISVGDTIEWHIYDSSKWVKSTVTMITRAPFEQGIVTTRKAIENLGYKFTPTRIITQNDVDDSLLKESSYIFNVTNKDEIYNKLSNYMDLINMCMGFMLVFAVFLAGIVLYSLGLLSFEERQKEMATLKVLGFRTKYLRGLMLKQNVILSLVGAIIGIPLGSYMLKLLVNSLGDNIDIPTSCSSIYIIISFAITVIVSVLVNYLFSKRIRTIDMVAEIKSAE